MPFADWLPKGRRAARLGALAFCISKGHELMKRKRTFIVVLAAILAGSALMAGLALAHVDVEKRSPKRGGSAKTSIGSVRITFSGPLRKGTLRVTEPGERSCPIGKGGRDPRNINRLIARAEKLEARRPLQGQVYAGCRRRPQPARLVGVSGSGSDQMRRVAIAHSRLWRRIARSLPLTRTCR